MAVDYNPGGVSRRYAVLKRLAEKHSLMKFRTAALATLPQTMQPVIKPAKSLNGLQNITLHACAKIHGVGRAKILMDMKNKQLALA